MPDLADDDWISGPAAARLLGLTPRTVRAMIDAAELPGEFILPSPRPKSRRRTIRVQRRDVHAYIERARVKPGDLTHLYLVASTDQ